MLWKVCSNEGCFEALNDESLSVGANFLEVVQSLSLSLVRGTVASVLLPFGSLGAMAEIIGSMRILGTMLHSHRCHQCRGNQMRWGSPLAGQGLARGLVAHFLESGVVN